MNRAVRILPLVFAVCLAPVPAESKTWQAAPGEAPRCLEAAAAGDTVLFARGMHRGALLVRTPLVLRGESGAVLDGGGTGTVLAIGASGTRVEDLEVRGSGKDVMHEDAGIRVIGAGGVRLLRLRIHDALYGVYAERATGLDVGDCEVAGRVVPGSGLGEGNGIHLWYCEAPVLRGNRVHGFLDAIYLSFTTRATLEANIAHACGRYGFHTMYCQEGRLVRNRFTRNVAGCAIMFSNHLDVRGNDFVRNQGSRTYGLLLRDCSDGAFAGNRIAANTVGLFMDNSNRNRFAGNLVQDNGWGVLLFSSCAGNTFAGNDFIQNDYPVALDMRYSDNHFDDGRTGNYWSDAAAYDLDGDGAGDAPFSPVTAFAFLSKQYPDLTLLARSPAVVALGAAERVFPALRPSEALDRMPLIRPIALPADRAPVLDASDSPARARPRRSRLGLGAFASLAALGAGGMLSSLRRRP